MEEWKDIKGYEGIYQVSSYGRIKSLPRGKQFGNRYYIMKEKILSYNNNGRGYLQVCLTKDKKSKKKLVHRLVAEAFLRKIEGKEYVNHIDGNKSNNRVDNLEWCTRSENQTHAYKNGLIGKENLSKAHKGKKHHNYGKHLSKETRNKISISNKGKRIGENSPVAKKVKCITTGEIFDTLTEAGKKYNIGNGDICKCCKGKIKYRGRHPITNEPLKWEYYNED